MLMPPKQYHFHDRELQKTTCSARSSQTWPLSPGGHSLGHTIMATLSEKYGQQTGMLNQCLNGQRYIYSTYSKCWSHTHFGEKRHLDREWIDHMCTEGPGSYADSLEGKGWTGYLRRPHSQTSRSQPAPQSFPTLNIPTGWCRPPCLMRQEQEEMEKIPHSHQSSSHITNSKYLHSAYYKPFF